MSKPTAAPAVGLVVLIALPLALILVPLNFQLANRDPLVFVGSFSILAWTTARLTQSLNSLKVEWLNLVFYSFSYVWLGVAGVAQTVTARNPMQTVVDDRLSLLQAGVILLGLGTYDVGRALATRYSQSSPKAFGVSKRTLDNGRVVAFGWFAIATTPIFVSFLGGLTSLFTSRDTLNQGLRDAGLYTDSGNAAGGTIVAFANAVPLVALLGLLSVRRELDFTKWSNRLLLLGLIGANVVLNNPVSMARYWFLTLLLSVVIILAKDHPTRVIPIFVLSFVVAAISIFPYLDAYRYANADSQVYESPLEFMTRKSDYGAVTDIASAIRLSEHQGHTDGRQFLGAVGFLVPRAFWTDKPPNTAYLIAEDTQFPNLNIDSPLWAEGYIDFGVGGVVIFLGVYGVATCCLDRRYRMSLHTKFGAVRAPAIWLIVVPALAAYEPIVIRGSLLQAMSRLFLLIILPLFMTRRSNQSARRIERMSLHE